jgi:hypothetical protein
MNRLNIAAFLVLAGIFALLFIPQRMGQKIKIPPISLGVNNASEKPDNDVIPYSIPHTLFTLFRRTDPPAETDPNAARNESLHQLQNEGLSGNEENIGTQSPYALEIRNKLVSNYQHLAQLNLGNTANQTVTIRMAGDMLSSKLIFLDAQKPDENFFSPYAMKTGKRTEGLLRQAAHVRAQLVRIRFEDAKTKLLKVLDGFEVVTDSELDDPFEILPEDSR